MVTSVSGRMARIGWSVCGRRAQGERRPRSFQPLTSAVMAKTVDICAGDELYFEYRKYLAEGEPNKHRHSMLAVKRFDMDYECDLRRHISIYEHAHLLMLKVVRSSINQPRC